MWNIVIHTSNCIEQSGATNGWLSAEWGKKLNKTLNQIHRTICKLFSIAYANGLQWFVFLPTVDSECQDFPFYCHLYGAHILNYEHYNYALNQDVQINRCGRELSKIYSRVAIYLCIFINPLVQSCAPKMVGSVPLTFSLLFLYRIMCIRKRTNRRLHIQYDFIIQWKCQSLFIIIGTCNMIN